MAFADQKMSSNRTIALGAVAVIHVLLGYALLNGLASKAIKLITDPIKTVNIKEEVKPPETPPPPPPKDIEIPPFVPPPEVQIENTTQVVAPIRQTVVETPRPTPVPVAPTPVVVAPPAPKAEIPPIAATPKGRGNTIGREDYPDASARANEHGRTTVSYTVTTDGKATGCSVTASSGFPRLDETACRLVERRFRFNPATKDGKPVTSTKSQAIVWNLEDTR